MFAFASSKRGRLKYWATRRRRPTSKFHAVLVLLLATTPLLACTWGAGHYAAWHPVHRFTVSSAVPPTHYAGLPFPEIESFPMPRVVIRLKPSICDDRAALRRIEEAIRRSPALTELRIEQASCSSSAWYLQMLPPSLRPPLVSRAGAGQTPSA